ncbi:succinylglutamate desuccinylase/aspartoacylase family protein [uncultured Muriicola sp.]|uniref:succinylglutamate desuccinylase/aspartoacylase family protein n=1 Tax=uncultured Muriicola sp. TaxID=1583102 RepID=UPI00261E7241|nr:succinylglutamate desuccinylase/aspartoacylase family protein [uncultured Muriicola sp.]
MKDLLVAPKKVKNRIIGHFQGSEPGPILVFFGGIHGNEPSGVQALEHVFKTLNKKSVTVKGSVYGILGNIPAILQKRRFLQKDLNRLWLKKEIERIKESKEEDRTHEEKELYELLVLINNLFDTHHEPFYFIDFHTTSSKTLPFITINDAMINRKFARLFPVPIILGIEEYLEGPLLSYINEFGYVTLGFESGQHATEEARTNSIAFFWLTMVYSGAIPKETVPAFDSYFKELKSSSANNMNFYEIRKRFAITPEDSFKMEPAFQSFQIIEKGTLLAHYNDEPVYAEKKSILFMPLYQPLGAEGYFIIKRIPKWILNMSASLRKVKADHLLTILPGVSWRDSSKKQLLVNLKVARFYSKAIFHLLGFRSRKIDQTHLVINNREKVAKNEMYKDSPWF